MNALYAALLGSVYFDWQWFVGRNAARKLTQPLVNYFNLYDIAIDNELLQIAISSKRVHGSF